MGRISDLPRLAPPLLNITRIVCIDYTLQRCPLQVGLCCTLKFKCRTAYFTTSSSTRFALQPAPPHSLDHGPVQPLHQAAHHARWRHQVHIEERLQRVTHDLDGLHNGPGRGWGFGGGLSEERSLSISCHTHRSSIYPPPPPPSRPHTHTHMHAFTHLDPPVRCLVMRVQSSAARMRSSQLLSVLIWPCSAAGKAGFKQRAQQAQHEARRCRLGGSAATLWASPCESCAGCCGRCSGMGRFLAAQTSRPPPLPSPPLTNPQIPPPPHPLTPAPRSPPPPAPAPAPRSRARAPACPWCPRV